MCLERVSVSSPLIAKTGIPKSSHKEAATSSWVDNGFEAHSTTSAPPALRVMARFAVSEVTWRQAETRIPSSGRSFSKRLRIADSTGICRSAQAIRRFPEGARAISLTSCFVVELTNCPSSSFECCENRRGLEHRHLPELFKPIGYLVIRQPLQSLGSEVLHIE